MHAQDTSTAAPQPQRQPRLSIDTSRVAAAVQKWSAETDEPLSPTARMFQDFYIVAVIGFATPINLATVRAGLEATLVHHPRFSSIRVMDGAWKNKGVPRWVRTTVNLDDHIVVPDLDPAATPANPDQALEDYVASLSTLPPMDHSRPLWELHVLDFPTSEAAAVVAFRVNHALGDGTSLVSLLLACTRSAADPEALPAMPPPPAGRDGPIHGRRRPAWSAGALAFLAWVLSYFLLAWHTVVDAARFVAMMLFGSDPRTVFKGVKGVEFRPKRFVHRSLSLDDVKHVKNALNCTVNDVLVGLTSAALSRYYFRKLGSTKKGVCVRSVLVVNVRPTPGIHKLAKMMESGRDNDVKWGNRFGYIILPFHIAMHDDPLDYVRKAKKTLDRKKNSLEAIFTHVMAAMIAKVFGVRVAAALFHRIVDSATIPFSNMIGPVEQIEFYGHPVVYIAPNVYGHPAALTPVWQSYRNTIKIVLAVDDAQFPDSHQLLEDFSESLKIIRDATSTTSKDQLR